jgi:hypothetical protein
MLRQNRLDKMYLEPRRTAARSIIFRSVPAESSARNIVTHFPQPSKKIRSVPVRQCDVTHKEIKLLLISDPQSVINAFRSGHEVAYPLKEQLHPADCIEVVVNEEDSILGSNIFCHNALGCGTLDLQWRRLRGTRDDIWNFDHKTCTAFYSRTKRRNSTPVQFDDRLGDRQA